MMNEGKEKLERLRKKLEREVQLYKTNDLFIRAYDVLERIRERASKIGNTELVRVCDESEKAFDEAYQTTFGMNLEQESEKLRAELLNEIGYGNLNIG